MDLSCQALAVQLGEAVKNSDGYRAVQAAREAVMENAVDWALVQEYRRLQGAIQLGNLQAQAEGDGALARFESLAELLFSKAETADFLLKQMQLDKMMGDLMDTVFKTAGIHMDIPWGDEA